MLARGVLMDDALVVERNRKPRLRQALVHTYPGMPQRCLEGMELCLHFDHVEPVAGYRCTSCRIKSRNAQAIRKRRFRQYATHSAARLHCMGDDSCHL